MNKNDVLTEVIDKCLKELYSYAQPAISWEDFVEENKIYSKKYKKWESEKDSNPKFKDKSITECIGPRPFEFYYLPREIIKEICDSYVYAYRLDQKQEFLDTISILKDYCKNPIVDKYIEPTETRLGYRSYDHPDNLEKEIKNYLISNYDINLENVGIEDICNIFYKFLDMAGDFYNWNRDLNSFNMSVYLGPSPNSNKQAVIDNWKEYRNKDIEINEEQIKKNFYGEELD